MEQGKYRDKKYALKKIAQLIKSNPRAIASALRHSKVFIENPSDKRELADKVAHSLANNLLFHKNIGLVLGANEAGRLNYLSEQDFSNLGGKGKIDYKGELTHTATTVGEATASGAQSGGWVGAIVGAVVGSINAGFSWAKAGKNAKIEEEQYRQELLDELFVEPKRNWTPVWIVGGVLLVGGVVTYFALKE